MDVIFLKVRFLQQIALGIHLKTQEQSARKKKKKNKFTIAKSKSKNDCTSKLKSLK